MSILLLIYWVVSLVTVSIQMEFIVYQGYNDVHVAIFDITIIMIVLYSFFVILELYFIADMVSKVSPF